MSVFTAVLIILRRFSLQLYKYLEVLKYRTCYRGACA